MINCIVVEDDPGHSDRLIRQLRKVHHPIKIQAVCRSVECALDAVREFHPDLIFLDIELEGAETGFELLQKTDNFDFTVIFTTAHFSLDYTIAAIRACALDYLIKPVNLNELQEAVNRFVSNKMVRIEQLKTFKTNLELGNYKDGAIWLVDNGGHIKIQTTNILYCKSDNEVTYFYLESAIEKKLQYITSKSIGQWEKDLEYFNIYRIHNRYLANLDHVAKYIREGTNSFVKMSDGVVLPVARDKKPSLLKRLQIR